MNNNCSNCKHWIKYSGVYNNKEYGECLYIDQWSDGIWLDVEQNEYNNAKAGINVMVNSTFYCSNHDIQRPST